MGFLDEMLKGAPAQAAARGEDAAGQPIPFREETLAIEAPKGDVVEAPAKEAVPASAEPTKDSDDDDDAATPADDGSGSIPKKAYLAERAKKRDYKTQLAETRGKLAAYEAMAAGKQPPAPTKQAAAAPQRMPNAIEDPDGHERELERRFEGVRLTADENAMRHQHGDDKVNGAFKIYAEAAALIPGLHDEVMKSRSPWGEIVKREGALAAKIEFLKDPEAYNTRLLADQRAKWETERSEGAPATRNTPQAAPKIPPSLAQARATGGKGTAEWQGPTPMGDMLGRHSVAGRRAG